MVDLAAVRAEIARQREIEAKATDGRVMWDGPVWVSVGENEELGECPWLVSEGHGGSILRGEMEASSKENAEKIVASWNTHRTLLDVAEAAAELRESIRDKRSSLEDIGMACDLLDAALKRLAEGQNG